MGFALMWAEGLAVALVSLALAVSWASRGRVARGLWPAFIFLVFLAPAAFLVAWLYVLYSEYGHRVRTPWVGYAFSWLVAFTALAAFLVWQGVRRPGAGMARPAAGWSRRGMWLGLVGAALALGLTFWNVDLGTRAELAVARQEASAHLLTMTPPPVPDSENAARVYAEAVKDLDQPFRDPWQDEAFRPYHDRDTKEADWKDPYVVGLVKQHEAELALLRKAAAMPRCSFGHQRSVLDVVTPLEPQPRKLRQGAILLAIDARVKATEGDLGRAFEDVSAILGLVRHAPEHFLMVLGVETMAWRTLEDSLRLAPAGKDALPALKVPELLPLVRKAREEQALLGLIGTAAASQPSLLVEQIRKKEGPVAAFAMDAVAIPTARVFLIPDELVAMRKLFDDYQKSPRSAADETPNDWAEMRHSVETDTTSLFSAVYVKPKHQVLTRDAGSLACLRQTARTGMAVEAYRRKHGQYPERVEQLVPEFFPAVPVDPRDGQPLRIKRSAVGVAVYAPQDSTAGEKSEPPTEWHRPPPVFRLPPRDGK